MNNLSDDELKQMLEKASEVGADKALRKFTDQVYQNVGKTMVKRFMEVVGMLIIAVTVFAFKQGWFK